jgi:hypothetical protein
LKAKTYVPSKVNKSCHRNGDGSWSPKVNTIGRSRHLELDALGIRTCIG